MDAIYAYQHQEDIGNSVAIIGGGSTGLELAKLLSQNHQVKVIEQSNNLCVNLNEHVRTGLLQKVAECRDLEILMNTLCLSSKILI